VDNISRNRGERTQQNRKLFQALSIIMVASWLVISTGFIKDSTTNTSTTSVLSWNRGFLGSCVLDTNVSEDSAASTFRAQMRRQWRCILSPIPLLCLPTRFLRLHLFTILFF